MEIDLAEWIGYAGSIGVSALIGGALVQYLKGRSEIKVAEIDKTANLDQSTNDFAVKLLAAADQRVEHWQNEVKKLSGDVTKMHQEILSLKKEAVEARTAIKILTEVLSDDIDIHNLGMEKARVFLATIETDELK